jgi:hypothetical protein
MSGGIIVNVPNVTDTAAALKLYYEKRELMTGDVQTLFGVGATTARRLKRMALEEQRKRGTPLWNARAVNTECAFAAWGLDVRTLENSLGRLRRLRLCENEAEGGRA